MFGFKATIRMCFLLIMEIHGPRNKAWMYIKYSVYAAIYNGKDRSDVQVFGTFTDQLNQLAQWLEQNGVKRVALESTGIYW